MILDVRSSTFSTSRRTMSTATPKSLRRFDPTLGLGSVLERWVTDWGAIVMDGIGTIGHVCNFFWLTLYWLFRKRPARETLFPNMYQVGVLSLPVVALTGTFIGMVMAVQSYSQFRAIGLETRLGPVINMALVRELGPVLAATMLAGRVGSSVAAELGTMRVTEQIDALASMGVNPIHYLVVPRFLACFLMIPSLTLMGDFMGMVGGYFYSVVILHIDKHHYWYNSEQFVGSFDLFSGVFKSFFFGSAIAIISCHRGFHAGAGAEGVGKSTIESFVYSFVMILILDLFLNIGLESVYNAVWPGNSQIR